MHCALPICHQQRGSQFPQGPLLQSQELPGWCFRQARLPVECDARDLLRGVPNSRRFAFRRERTIC